MSAVVAHSFSHTLQLWDNNTLTTTTIMREIYFAGGCFWGTQHLFKPVRGVVATEVGYANGITESPTYEEVYSDQTGHAECVKVVYDPEVVALEVLLKLFFRSIDPLSLNRQGADCGTRYRTGIYYTREEDIPVIESIYCRVEQEVGEGLMVEFEPLRSFYSAEEYHQDYLDKNPSGYCHISLELFHYARHINSSEESI